MVKAQAEQDQQEKEKSKATREGIRDEAHRGFGKTEKVLKDMDAHVLQNTSFFSTWNPDTIEKELKTFLAT